MANLGNLWYTLGVKDDTEKGLAAAMKRFEKLSAKLGLQVDEVMLRQSIERVLNGKTFKAKVEVSGGGISAGKLREVRAGDISARAAERAALSQQRVRTEVERTVLARQRVNTEMQRTAAATARAELAQRRLTQEFHNQHTAASGLGRVLQETFSLYGLQRFSQALVEIGGQMETQRIAINAMLGDRAKSAELFGQLKGLAVESPFTFMNIAGYAKQLTAYQIPYNELYETTKRLADISAGLGVDMQRIILAFGQVRSATVLKLTEARQFTEAGIPLFDKLAKQFTELEGRAVSVGEVFERITRREVSFEMVRDALWEMTDAGGRFYDMQSKLTDSLSGKFAKLKDTIEIAFGDLADGGLGDSMKGLLDVTTALVGVLVKNQSVLVNLGIAYGVYRVAVVAQTAIQRVAAAQNIALTTSQNWLRASTLALTVSLKSLRAALALTPAGWIGALLAVGAVIWGLVSDANRLDDELAEIGERGSTEAKNLADGYKVLVSQLKHAKEGAEEYNDIREQIMSRYGDYLGKIDAEKNLYDQLAGSVDRVTAAIRNKQMAQAREEAFGALSGEYNDDMADYVEELIDLFKRHGGYSEESAKKAALLIRSELELSDGTKNIHNIADEVYKSLGLEKVTAEYELSSGSSGVKISGDKVREYLNSMANEYKDFLESKAAAEEKLALEFGIDGGIMGKRLDELNKEEEIARKSLSSKSFEGVYQKILEEKRKVYEDHGQFDEVRRIDAEIAALGRLKDTWYETSREVMGAAGVAPNLLPTEDEGKAGDTLGYLTRLAKAYKEAKEAKEELNKIPEGIRGLKAVDDLKRAETLINAAMALAEKLGFNIDDFTEEEKKKGGKEKDAFAEQMRERLRLMKEAYNMYKKWEGLVGSENALKKVRESGLFRDLFALMGDDFDPSAYGNNVDKFLEILRGKTKKGQTQREKLILEGEKLTYEIDFDAKKEDVEAAMRKVNEWVEEETRKWDLFKRMWEGTGDREVAMQLAYGRADLEGMDDYVEVVKRAFDDAMKVGGLDYTFAGLEATGLEGVPDGVRKMWEEVERDMRAYTQREKERMAELVTEYQSQAEKIVQIEADMARDLADIDRLEKDGRITDDRAKNLRERVTSSAGMNVLKETARYINLYAGAFAMTRKEVELTAREVKDGLNAQLEAGVITANEYAEEMTKLQDAVQEAGGSGFADYLEGGFEGLFERQKKEGEALMRKGASAFQDAKADNDASGMQAAQAMMDAGNEMYGQGGDAQQTIMWIDKAIHAANSSAQNLKTLSELWKETLVSMDKNTREDSTIGRFSNHMNTFATSSQYATAGWDALKNGDPLGAVTNAISAPMSIWKGLNETHDLEIEEDIEDAKTSVDELRTAWEMMESAVERGLNVDAVERAIASYELLERQLRSVNSSLSDTYKGVGELLKSTGDLYTTQYVGLVQQQQLTLYMLQQEMSKKNVDWGVVGEYRNQLAELNETIMYYVQDMVAELYELDLSDWGRQLGDALMDAFRRGEDAAAAFEETSADMIAGVVNNMLRMAIIEPMMKKLQDKLFGKQDANGNFKGGMLNLEDISKGLDGGLQDAMVMTADFFKDEMGPVLSSYGTVFEGLNEAMGGILSTTEGGSSMRGGIQSITEDTADLLASYINAVRGDVSVKRELMERFVGVEWPRFSLIAQAQLTQLSLIANNTGETAAVTGEIRDLLRAAKQGKSSGFWIR